MKTKKRPFCSICKDVRTVSLAVKVEWKDEQYRSIPCPECMAPIDYVPAARDSVITLAAE